ALFTLPLVGRLPDTLPDWNDAADSTWRIGTISRNLLTDPLHLYRTPALYPLDNALALDELLTGQGFFAAPVVWLTGNTVLAYNLLNFLSFALSGFAMWLLVRHLTGSYLAGLVAGMVFAFSPWHYGQYGHLGLAAQFWMVFALYFLVRFLEESEPPARPANRRSLLFLGLFALCFFTQALVAGYYAYFAAILVAIYMTYHVAFRSGAAAWLWSRLRRRTSSPEFRPRVLFAQLGLLAAASAMIVALLAPFVLPFAQAKSGYGFTRALDEVSYWSAGLKSLLRTTRHSWLYEPVQVNALGLETSAEREMYPGLVASLFAVVGLVAWRSGRKWAFAAVAFVGLLLSFGPYFNLDAYGEQSTGIPLPYKWLYEHVPGFDALRVPQRFGQLFMLGVAVCAGYGAAALARWASVRRTALRAALPLVAVVLVAVEFFGTGLPDVHTGTGAASPEVYRWLASEEGRAEVPPDALLLELPVSQGESAINTSPIYMVYELEHRRPMLNGSANIVPRGYERLYSEMRRFPTPGTLDIIEGLGVKYLLVHTGGLLNDGKRADLAAEAASPGGRVQLVRSFPDTPNFPEGSRAELYRLVPAQGRFDRLRDAVPPGSSVWLVDHPARLRLYNTALPALLGPDRTYYADFTTIYDAVTGRREPAQPGALYDYAAIYQGDDPTKYGYREENRVDIGENDIISVYRK
ncbi:MAG TPA: hypothetical protein VFR15_12655, partial [Chloroflexia bacterium]|nr:hypothetical protein [Chloroflexia bacterium]